MAEELGNVLYARWEYPATTAGGASFSAGTVTLSTDFRDFGQTGSINSIDKSAGADTRESYLPGLIRDDLTAQVLHDGGTALFGAFKQGLSGTLVYGPSGTADGKMKISWAAFVESANLAIPYQDVKIWDLAWKPTADPVYAVWASGA